MNLVISSVISFSDTHFSKKCIQSKKLTSWRCRLFTDYKSETSLINTYLDLFILWWSSYFFVFITVTTPGLIYLLVSYVFQHVHKKLKRSRSSFSSLRPPDTERIEAPSSSKVPFSLFTKFQELYDEELQSDPDLLNTVSSSDFMYYVFWIYIALTLFSLFLVVLWSVINYY